MVEASTLGKALITEVRENRLYQRIEFATEANPMARIAYGLYRGRFLNAVSVGFIPLRWENGSAETECRRRHLEQELLEVSAVGIPANPEALQRGLSAGAIQAADIQQLLDLLGSASRHSSTEQSHSDTAVPNTHARAPGVRDNGAHLLQLARDLRRLLRGA